MKTKETKIKEISSNSEKSVVDQLMLMGDSSQSRETAVVVLAAQRGRVLGLDGRKSFNSLPSNVYAGDWPVLCSCPGCFCT